MGKVILFSPIGGTDPISQNNAKDGSLLHICRFYQPDDVYLYMSKEILENHKKDNRYIYCLDKLSEKNGHKMDYHIIERSDLVQVNEFNFFFGDFKKEVDTIIAGMDSSDTLYFNVSSGTPAMKMGLIVLGTLLGLKVHLIQVDTPVKKMNEHTHSNEDIEFLWECDEDNEEGAENRCHEIMCPSLLQIQRKDIIKKHINSYDYQAAIDVAEAMDDKASAPFIDYLRAARARQLLDMRSYDKLSNSLGLDILPVKGTDGRKYFEYALDIQNKLKRGEYADFIRAVTPLIAELFENILAEQCGIKISDYYHLDKKGGGKAWNSDLLYKNPELFDVLLDGRDRLGKFVMSAQLTVAIEHYSDNAELKNLVAEVRDMEGNVRNMAAHQIVSVNEDMIKKNTGLTPQQIMNDIKKLFFYTNIKVRKDDWNSYDVMNDLIIDIIDRSEI